MKDVILTARGPKPIGPYSQAIKCNGLFVRFRASRVVDASIAEIAHCCDHLDVDGFVLLTNVDGTYVSDASFEPVFRELDRRGARVLLHPTSPACWEHTSFGRPRPMLEFFFDTTRAVVDLVLNGTIDRHPNLTLIIPHAGATLPLVADRVSAFAHAPRSRRRRAPRPGPAPLRPRRLPRTAPARRAADDHDARPPPLRERLPFTPESIVAAAAASIDGVRPRSSTRFDRTRRGSSPRTTVVTSREDDQ